METKVYEEIEKLKVEKGVELEIKGYFTERNSPAIVWATGLGGAAGACPFFEDLAQTHRIVSFSPRNCAASNGHLTLDNYLSDIKKLVDHVSQKQGRKPYGMGHSMGGYAFGYLLGESLLVERAVLLAPLIRMDEQIPPLINYYFKNKVDSPKKVPLFYSPSDLFFPVQVSKHTFEYRAPFIKWLLSRSRNLFGLFDKQRFVPDDILSFLKSVYESQLCEGAFLAPTKVFLTGGTCFRLPISQIKLEKLAQSWKNIGAEVEIYPHLNHWFSGTRWFSGVGEFCGSCRKEGITEKIREFFN